MKAAGCQVRWPGTNDKSELQCCGECICSAEFRWESNEKHKENILIPLINCFYTVFYIIFKAFGCFFFQSQLTQLYVSSK